MRGVIMHAALVSLAVAVTIAGGSPFVDVAPAPRTPTAPRPAIVASIEATESVDATWTAWIPANLAVWFDGRGQEN